MNRKQAAAKYNMSEAELLDLTHSMNGGTKPKPDFRKLSKILPEDGVILDTINGRMIEIYEEFRDNDGRPCRLLSCTAKINDEGTAWVIHSRKHGLRVMISVRSFDNIIEKDGKFYVNKVKVVRKNEKKTALICEAL